MKIYKRIHLISVLFYNIFVTSGIGEKRLYDDIFALRKTGQNGAL